jgi:short-subunit dehydrogenase
MAHKDLKGKLVLITGGARGIGRATAVEFLRAGARVVVADIDLPLAETCARELSASGEIHAMKLDVTKRSDFDQVVDRIEQNLGPLEVLVNNAGIMSLGKFLDLDEQNDRRQIDINVMGVLHGMRAVLPKMLGRGQGHIVNVASLAGRIGIPHATTYTATKFAVIGATESVRNELRGSGIELTYVMPYLVNTELAAGAGGLAWPPIVQPEDVAKALVKGVQKNRLEVYVPKIGKLAAMLPAILPRPLVDLAGLALGLNKLFKKVDAERRAEYVARTAAPGDEKKDPKLEPNTRGNVRVLN